MKRACAAVCLQFLNWTIQSEDERKEMQSNMILQKGKRVPEPWTQMWPRRQEASTRAGASSIISHPLSPAPKAQQVENETVYRECAK